MTEPHYDVFLSHNSKDKPAVERIAEKLRQLGLEPWLDKWHLAAGKSFQEGIEAGLRASGACAVFYGPHGPGAWQKAELEVAQDRAVKDPDFRLFLVLLPGVPEPFDATALPAFLNMRTWVDLRTGYEDPARFQPLVNAIAGIPLGPTAVVETDDATPPYRGLQVFDEEHAEFFFGREADVQRLLEKLKSSRFLAVVGPSGSGKSSLVRAGLLPELKNGALPGSHDWPVRVFKPGPRPLDALAAQLVQLDPNRPMGRTLDELKESPRTLDLAATLLLDGRPQTTRLLLVIDQFEEVFTLCHSEEDRVQFLDNLLHAATVLDGRCVVILTLRADFYPRCAAYPELAALMSAHQALVGPLDERGLRAVIVEPARRVGLSFEPGLVETIIGDVGREPGALPLLEHALLELWERRQGTMLTLAGYRDSGGVGRAIANRADAIFEGLAPPEQAVARRILMRLTQPGEQTEDTRRRADLNELVTRPDERGAVEKVVDQLVAARLLTAGQDADEGAAQVDVAHEALIRAWPRLRAWLDEDREGFLVHNRLTESTQEWDRLNRDPDALYRGARLTEAQALAAKHPDLLNEQERAFLAASVELREREITAAEERRKAQERQRRLIVIGLAAFSLVALILAGIAGLQWRQAGQEADRANVAAGQALAAQSTAEAENQRAAAEAAAAAAAKETAEAETRRADAEAAAAVAAQGTAEAQSTVAANGRNNALTSSFNANIARSTAEAAREVAEAQRQIAGEERDNAVLQATAAAIARDRSLVQERIARSRQLAAQARIVRKPDLALQLSLESVRLDPESAETRGSLATTLMSKPSLRGVLPAHSSLILGLAFSPDGARVATAGADGVLQIWDTATLAPVGEPLVSEPTGALSGLAFSPDGTKLVVAGDFGPILFDMTSASPSDTGRQLALDFPWFVNGFAFSPDSSRLAFATDQGVTLWDIAADAPTGEMMQVEGEQPIGVVFSPDGRLLATMANSAVRLWDVVTQDPVGEAMTGDGIYWSMAFSPDGELLATGDATGAVQFWDVATQTRDGDIMRSHDGIILNLAFSPDGEQLATSGNDGTVVVLNVATRSVARGPWRGHDSAVHGVAFKPDGELLASSGADGALVLWDLSTDTSISRRLSGPPGLIFGVDFSPDGQRIASAVQETGITLWDANSGEPVGEPLAEHVGAIWDVAFSPDMTLLASGGEDGAILWDLTREEAAPERLVGYDAGVHDVAFSPDGTLLATAGAGDLVIWDVVSREARHTFPTTDGQATAIGTVAFSPDGRLVATGDVNGFVTIWDLMTEAPLAISEAGQGSTVLGLAFSSDGERLVQAGTNGMASVIDVATGATIGQPIRISNGAVWDVAFAANDTQLAAGGDDGVVLWDLAKQAPIGEPLITDSDAILSIALSPEGTRLAAGDDEGAVIIWEITVAAWQARACEIIHGNMDPETWAQYLGDEPYRETCPDEDQPALPPGPVASPIASPVAAPVAAPGASPVAQRVPPDLV